MLKRLSMFVPFLFVLAIALVVGGSGSVYAEGPDQAAEEAREAEIARQDDDGGPSLLPNGRICGTYFYDKNGNGIQEPNEQGLSGRVIEIDLQSPGWGTVGEVTDSNGSYCITLYQMTPGQVYTVSVFDHYGWVPTFPLGAHYVTFAPWNGGPYELISDVNFGARLKRAPIGPAKK